MEIRKKLTYRMYGLVAYQLSEIQKGIQFGHAVVEYGLEFGNSPEYQKWAKEDKTFIILNGGTTNTRYDENDDHIGSLNNHRQLLSDEEVQFRSFFEPDLGDQLTAVVFLVDDRVFDKKIWPDYNGTFYVDGTPEVTEYWNWIMKFSDSEQEARRIVFLREFLKNFRLA
jgi:hypothetical protein